AGVEGEGVHGVTLWGRQRVGYLRWKSVWSVQVNPEKTLGPHSPEGGCHDGTPITALSGPILVAKTLHEFHPGACDPGDSPPRLARLLGKPESGSDGTTTSNESSMFPPNATGSVSGPMSFRNSTIEPGHPCVKMRGIAFGFFDLTWMK